MKLVVSLAVTGLSIGLSAAAFAADISPAPVYTKAPIAPFTWTRAYFGGNAGYGWSTNVDTITLTDPNGTGAGLNDKGGFVGLELGYNYQIGMFVLGVETDGQASNLANSYTSTFGANTLQASSNYGDWVTVRGRAGVAWNHFLFYGTGGWALASVSNTLQLSNPNGNNAFLQNDATQSGYVVGAGIEYAVDPRWSIKVEYQYLNFGSYTLSGPLLNGAGTQIGTTTSSSINNDIQTVRFGVNWKFVQ